MTHPQYHNILIPHGLHNSILDFTKSKANILLSSLDRSKIERKGNHLVLPNIESLIYLEPLIYTLIAPSQALSRLAAAGIAFDRHNSTERGMYSHRQRTSHFPRPSRADRIPSSSPLRPFEPRAVSRQLCRGVSSLYCGYSCKSGNADSGKVAHRNPSFVFLLGISRQFR